MARRPLEREPLYLDGGRRTTQLMRDSLGRARENGSDMQEAPQCPWCKMDAAEGPTSVCQSAHCDCGAIGLGASPDDTDEIVDEAIRIFQVRTEETSRGFNDLLLADVVRSGVEVRGGLLQSDLSNPFPSWRWMWFRKL